MHPEEVIVAIVAISVLTNLVMFLAYRFFRRRQEGRRGAGIAAERAPQYAARPRELEARVRVLEQIVTDGGAQTAAQIEALRDRPRLENGDKVQ